MMPAIMRIYNEARDGTGALDATERAAAVTICAHATSPAEARILLAMCGLLRKGGPS
jgi:hypothetical protein